MLIYLEQLNVVINTDEISYIEPHIDTDELVNSIETENVIVSTRYTIILKSNKRFIVVGNIKDLYYQIHPELKPK